MRKFGLFVLFAAIGFTSCSPQGPEVPMSVSGTSLEGAVTYGDQPVPFAMVIITQAGSGGGAASALSDEDGKFKVDNVPVGQVKIGVNTEAGKGQMMSRAMAGTDPTAKGGKKAKMPKLLDLPKKFQDPESSGLTTTTEKGVNKFDIKIAK